MEETRAGGVVRHALTLEAVNITEQVKCVCVCVRALSLKPAFNTLPIPGHN